MILAAVPAAVTQPLSFALATKHAINLRGNGVLIDSFDSSNPAKSTNGRYDPTKYQGDYGDVATADSGIVGVQNALIYGKLHTGPVGGYSIGPSGGVGTHAWLTANGGGMEPGHFLQDANFGFPDTTLPNTTGYLTPQPGTVVLISDLITSNSTTTAALPDPPPWGWIFTNVSYITTSNYPSPVPPDLSTNTFYYFSPSVPDPIPAGIVTNTYAAQSRYYPASGTYIPPVTQVGYWYYYNAIVGYSWTAYTYSYPTFTYTYYLYQTNRLVVTNHYDNVLHANTRYVSGALVGNTIVFGPNVTLVLPNGLSGAENIFFNYNDNLNPGLTVYAGGISAVIDGGRYINPSGFAGSLIVYCAPSVTNLTLKPNELFTGALVAPNADLVVQSISMDQGLCGSLMVNSLALNGHFQIHWDESLARLPTSPPSIAIHPWCQTVTVGHPAAFTTSLSGVLPQSYQWNFAGTNIPNATNSSLTIPSANTSDAGNYSVIVTTSAGSVTSYEASLVVNASPPWHTLSTSTPGGGSISVNPPGTRYPNNAWVTVTAIPDPGWTFLNWLGDATGSSPSATVTMNRSKSLQAVFGTSLNMAVVGSGAASAYPLASLYPFGSVVRVAATPQPGSSFDNWADAGGSAVNPLYLAVTNANPTVTAVFAELGGSQAALTVIPKGFGRVMASPPANSYVFGAEVTLTATPDAGQTFLGWGGDASGTKSPLFITMDRSQTITAEFTRLPSLTTNTALDGTTEDGFRLTLTGEPGGEYWILGSTNLLDWLPVGTVTNTYGTVQLTDAAAANLPFRFYRAVPVQP